MLFSIISPFYNVEQYTRKCIESVLAQTEKDFEYILVDDGSRDRVPEILDEYAAKDSRIKVIHKKNGGIVSARKAGAEVALGEYIVIVDGDDWLHEQCLEKLKQVIMTDSPELILHGYYRADEDGHTKAVHIKPAEEHFGLVKKKEIKESTEQNLFAFPPTVWAKAFKRERYVKFQMALDNRIAMGDDGAVVYPLVCATNSIYFLDECLYYYRQNPTSMTHHRNISLESVIIRLNHFEKMLPTDLNEKDRQLSKYACHAFINAAISQFQNKEYTVARKEIRAYLSDPTMRHYLKYKPVYASRLEKLSYFVLKYRLLLSIKIYSIFA